VSTFLNGKPGPFYGEFMALLDFPPAPKLGIDGKLESKEDGMVEKGEGRSSFSAKAIVGACIRLLTIQTTLWHNLNRALLQAQNDNGEICFADGPYQ